jgi:WD40 repeat protein
LEKRLQFHRDEVQALLVMEEELFSGSDDGVVNVYTPLSEHPIRSTSLSRPIMAFAEFGPFLVVGCGDGGILFLRAKDLSLFAELKSHESSVMALSVSQGQLFSASFDRTVRVWSRVGE